MTHGAPGAAVRHVGDLGNVAWDPTGVANINIEDSVARLDALLGRAIVVHGSKDDFGLGTFADSKTTGHAGVRLGCCLITGATAITAPPTTLPPPTTTTLTTMTTSGSDVAQTTTSIKDGVTTTMSSAGVASLSALLLFVATALLN